MSSTDASGDAAAADTSREDAPSGRHQRRAQREASRAEAKADEAGREAERTDDTAEEIGNRAEQAGSKVYSELAGLGTSGEGEAPIRAVELLGRVGLAGYGLVHVLIGIIAGHVALAGGGQPDQQGALRALAAGTPGFVGIIVVVVGLVAFAVWQGVAAATGFRWTSGGTRFRKRVGAGAKTVAVLAVALVGVRLLVTGSSGSSSSAGSESLTAGLLTLPAGRILVAVLGAVVVGIAVAMGYTGIARTFSDDLDYDRLPDRLRRPVEVLGVAGHVARAIAFAIVGVLFVVAAWRADPRTAGGLDQALTLLAGQPFGPFLLLVVGVGIAAFGVYSFAESWTRRI
ncbi:DUF1206 domain-containing protein [Actinomycetospora cinnamomea]|uniref:Uncharacterized protein DUF1206 n=1 Tax=Actinomycetospora cinnamomea TaxID=663609 RepID=A0A2U1EB27_9PSEU|nr:DUF1206 domain-containing protein [Actinomycetospora cinnamomea]PVY97107.1 uncharacterized protein DUF1206 [Actinomycetospora cinnamomea]